MEQEVDYLRLFELVERDLQTEFERHWENETAIIRKHGLTWFDWVGIIQLARVQMQGADRIHLDHGTVVKGETGVSYVLDREVI